jgi:exopolysaccharide production protein ExoQ
VSYSKPPHAGSALQVGRPPWLTFLFLAAVFFLVYHDLTYSKKGIDNYNLSEDDLVTQVTQGSLTRPIALLSLGLFAIVSLARRRANGRLRINGPLGWILLGFAAWAFLSLIWAEDVTLTLKRLVVFGILCIAAAAITRGFSLREIILWTLFATSLFLVIGVFAEVFFGTFRPFASGYRFAGTIHPNGEGIDCGLLLLSAVAAAHVEKQGRVLYWACGLLGLVFLILTQSRTAFAAVLVAFVAYFAAVSSKRTKIVVTSGLAMALWIPLVVGGGALLPELQAAVTLGRGDSNIHSFNGRTEIWDEVSYYVHRRPVLGYGYGGFWNEDHITEMSAENQWGVGAGHSAYLDCLLELGLVGLITYVLAFLLGIRRAFYLHRISHNAAFAFLGAVLVFSALDGLLESILMTPTLPLFVSMIAAIRLACASSPRKPEEASIRISEPKAAA